jgi:transposase
VLSISLGLPEFQIVKQELLSYGYAIHVEKTETQERCPHVGFLLPLSMTDGHEKYGI